MDIVLANSIRGLSDYLMSVYTSLGAVALGAADVEKHFIISRSWLGPDCPISIEPDELTELVKGSRATWLAHGGSKTVLLLEQLVIDFAYASIVTIKEVKAGEVLSLGTVWVKRPGTGPIKAEDFDEVLRKIAHCDLPADVQIAPEDFA